MNNLSMHTPLFSIVTITKNNRGGLEKTYRSIASQICTDYEWIIVDGASTDTTLEFLKSETDRIQNKYLIQNANNGIYDSMNQGIKASKGGYILFLNAGDELASADVFEAIKPHTEKFPDFIYGDALEGEGRELKQARRYKDLPWGMITHHQAMLYRRQTIWDLKLKYSILYEIAGDYDFTARFLGGAKAIVYISKPICVFEQGGISQQKASLGRKEQYLIREQLELVSPTKNAWIYLVQTCSWQLKQVNPTLYKTAKQLILNNIDKKRKISKPASKKD